jgi:hypothetical protein
MICRKRTQKTQSEIGCGPQNAQNTQKMRLPRRRIRDKEKEKLERRLRAETTAPLSWIAE